MMKSSFFDVRARAITKAFLITGGTEKIRADKINDLIREATQNRISMLKLSLLYGS